MCSINVPTLDWIRPHRREVRCAVVATSRLLKRYRSPRLDERGCRMVVTPVETRTGEFALHTLDNICFFIRVPSFGTGRFNM